MNNTKQAKSEARKAARRQSQDALLKAAAYLVSGRRDNVVPSNWESMISKGAR